MNKPIKSFRGDYYFLSNFYRVSVTLDGIEYPTAEHAFQAQKTLLRGEREHIAQLKAPSDAKSYGRKLTLREDWEQIKIFTMLRVVLVKFGSHKPLLLQLLATGANELEEGNNWGDKFWGTVDGKGKNVLGKILMEVRLMFRTALEEGKNIEA